MFSTNLDLIMKLTDTQASALGAACHLDPSHVSRLRTGTRPLPKNPGFLRSMSEYFARRIKTEQQKKAICGLLNTPSFPEDISAAASMIEEWLAAEERGGESITDISPLIKSFAAPAAGSYSEPSASPELSEIQSYYYGIQGKREAVLSFFALILKEKKPRTLLLFSDEEMDWLFEDSDFAARWLISFTKVLSAGNRVRIIHNTGRRINEMLEAVAKWIPVYKTGMIEPYYYPRIRDGVFQRTLFIAPELAAVVSASVDLKSDGMLNELITDKEAVRALTLEFERYFSFCRPLMQIMTPASRGELWKAYDALISTEGNFICMSDMPTLVTMPDKVARAMQKRAPESCILERKKAAKAFIDSLGEGRSYTEIIPTEFPSQKPPALPCAELLGAQGLAYTDGEWAAHVESCEAFASRGGGYVQLRRDKLPKGVTITVKEERGVIMTKDFSPCVAFALSEQNLVNSFQDFLTKNK